MKQSGSTWVGVSPEPTPPSYFPHSSSCDSCAHSPGCCWLHGDRNRSCVHSSEDDVCSCDRQWGRCCSRKPGSHPTVSGGCWTLYIIQHHLGNCWSSCWGLALNIREDTSAYKEYSGGSVPR